MLLYNGKAIPWKHIPAGPEAPGAQVALLTQSSPVRVGNTVDPVAPVVQFRPLLPFAGGAPAHHVTPVASSSQENRVNQSSI